MTPEGRFGGLFLTFTFVRDATSKRPEPLSQYYQVISMHQFDIGQVAEHLGDLLGAQAADALGGGRGVIAQPAGVLLAGRVAEGDDIAFAEGADHLKDADRQQALT